MESWESYNSIESLISNRKKVCVRACVWEGVTEWGGTTPFKEMKEERERGNGEMKNQPLFWNVPHAEFVMGCYYMEQAYTAGRPWIKYENQFYQCNFHTDAVFIKTLSSSFSSQRQTATLLYVLSILLKSSLSSYNFFSFRSVKTKDYLLMMTVNVISKQKTTCIYLRSEFNEKLLKHSFEILLWKQRAATQTKEK